MVLPFLLISKKNLKPIVFILRLPRSKEFDGFKSGIIGIYDKKILLHIHNFYYRQENLRRTHFRTPVDCFDLLNKIQYTVPDFGVLVFVLLKLFYL